MGLGGFGGAGPEGPPNVTEGAGQAPPLTGCLRPFHSCLTRFSHASPPGKNASSKLRAGPRRRQTARRRHVVTVHTY